MSARLTPVFAADVSAPVLRLDEPISFWGGVDQYSGRIADRTHPQVGQNLAGTLLIVPMIRGSGGTPGSLATLLKHGRGPAGIVLNKLCMNVLTGLLLAEKLYGARCPLFLDETRLAATCGPGVMRVTADGRFEMT